VRLNGFIKSSTPTLNVVPSNVLLIIIYLTHYQVHVRGGSIIPGKGAAMTTHDSLNTDSTLMVALDGNGEASGDLYIDDGETINASQ